LSYETFSFTREELRKYKEQFFLTYIRPFDIHIRQLVDMRNKLHEQVKQMDKILHDYYFTSNIIRIDQYSFDGIFGGSTERIPDKWQEIFNEIIVKVNHNTCEFNNLDGAYLGDLQSLDLDQRIIRSIKNS
jgi:hypothetical protein